jgi:phage terminase small subunit
MPKKTSRPVIGQVGNLTAQQERFAQEYIKDLDAKAAAIRAGYSPKTASSQGSQLTGHPQILARVVELQQERNRRTQIDADWVMVRLLEELQADAADLFDEQGTLKKPHEWPKVWRRGLISGIRTTELYSKDSEGRNVVIGHLKDVAFFDRTKRIELLGKHVNVQAFREKLQVGVDDPLKELFRQISGQSVRPTIEHREDEKLEQPRPLPNYAATKGED